MLRTVLLTILALIAFASNSLLCRLALGGHEIDPASFTSIRLLAGAVVLLPLARLSTPDVPLARSGSWISATALFVYALAFSFAYVSLGAATGALLLFGAVQLTMIAFGLSRGERLGLGQWAGLAAAIGGLGWLLFPGASAPPIGGTVLMTLAGVAWGAYTLRGRGVPHPLATTAANFGRSTIFTLGASALSLGILEVSSRGAVLAAISGAVTSGLGYVIWYAALRGLRATSAAVVQLAVPPIAAVGGILFLDEPATMRLAVASLLTIGGISAVLTAPASRARRG